MSSNVFDLIKNGLEKSMSRDEYYGLINRLHKEEKATGPNPSESYFGYSKLNLQRISRIRKTVKLTDELKAAIGSVSKKQIWLVITESWCGDAAQSIPVFEAAAELSEAVEIRYVLRDENVELIDQFLTNGGRAIPIVLVLDRDSGALVATWGARPKEAQRYFLEMREADLPGAEISENLQRWYNKDKQRLIQKELTNVLVSIEEEVSESV